MLLRALVVLLVCSFVSPGCGPQRAGRRDPAAAVRPSQPVDSASRPLSPQDLQVYLAVRGRALTYLENALSAVERGGGDPVSSVQELGVAEQRAAESYHIPWARYSWIRNEIGRLISLQRRAQDARVLAIELERTRSDLESQLSAVRDGASRQFLEAQIARLSAELARLASERAPSEEEVAALALLESARAELALLQGRQEKLQRRLRDSIRRERPAGGSPPIAETDHIR